MARGRTGKGTALGLALVALAFVRCSGKPFSPSDEPALGGSSAGGTTPGGGGTSAGALGGAAGTGGGATGGSASGGDTSGGGSDNGGSDSGGSHAGSESGGQGDGGTGGAATCDDETPCPSGHYCNGEGACAPCSDIATLDDPGAAVFTTPEPLSALNDTAGDFFLRTPRAFGSGNGLVYVRDYFGGEIWLTGDAETDVGAPLPSPVNEPDQLEGSPLWLGAIDGSFDGFNFVFNRAADRDSPYELYAADVAANGTASDLRALAAPFNPTPALTQSAYAMALSAERAWWVVNRDLMFSVQLLTAPLDDSGPPSVVPLELSNGCRLVEFDYSPWVTPDGTLLFLNATERGDDCSQVASSPMDIVVVRLDETGQPLGPATPLSSVNHSGVTELDASLSPDLCSLYFITSVSDKLRVMRARRTGGP